MYKTIIEGKAKIKIPSQSEKKISKEMPVFYNPVMEFNRTISVLLLSSVKNKSMKIALPLGGTGVRAARFIKELPRSKIKKLYLNDINKEAIKIIRQNLKLNKITTKVEISNKEANLFLTESQGFDYIDIDPFGSPNTFLDASIKHLGRCGILAVTATDTGCLAGTYPKACKRKYWAVPKKDSNMHETGLRILIRKIQLIGSDHNKSLTPIYSYFKDHYFRTFLLCEKGKIKVDNLLKQHGMIDQAGPLWLGRLWNSSVASDIAKISDEYSKKFTETIKKESNIPTVGFYNIPSICKKYKLQMVKQEDLIKKIIKAGYKVAETHFAPNSLRSDIPIEKFIKLFR